MSLESAIQSKSREYIALRKNLRARARDWVEERAPKTAQNARRQLNQAFDAGVSATIELLRDRELLNLTDDEVETIIALRAGTAGVIAISERVRASGRGADARTGSVRGAEPSREGTGNVAPTVRETERDEPTLAEEYDEGDANLASEQAHELYVKAVRDWRDEVCYPAPCDIDGREVRLGERVVWIVNPGWGPGTVKFLSADGKRVKVLFDHLPDYRENVNTNELRMLDGSL